MVKTNWFYLNPVALSSHRGDGPVQAFPDLPFDHRIPTIDGQHVLL